MCLAVHMGADPHNFTQVTKELFHEFTNSWDTGSFSGIRLKELGEVEDLFQININVFKLMKLEDDTVTSEVVRRTCTSYDTTANLNLYEAEKYLISAIYAT